MRILHTSDWHLGRVLYGQKRQQEFTQFLDWLLQTICDEKIDCLLIAGDVFDTNTPSNQAQQLYYRFLANVAASPCRHVVVIGGNHDSPSFLDAPGYLLQALNVHVIGQACENPADEVITLRDGENIELLVCAVPYLRDRDLRRVEANESIESKDQKIIQGIREHYQACANEALRLRGDLQVPVVGMGHLFVSGGQVEEGDGVRDLYVGSLGQVHANQLPNAFDYLALGHLHVPQVVAGDPTKRYCGSPIAMGFGEAKQQKQVLIVDFDGRTPAISTRTVPRFQTLARLRGDLPQLKDELTKLMDKAESIWVEVEYQGHASVQNLRQQLMALTEDSQLRILRIRNQKSRDKMLSATQGQETLQELSVQQVFKRRLDASEVTDQAQRAQLQLRFDAVLQAMQEADPGENS